MKPGDRVQILGWLTARNAKIVEPLQGNERSCDTGEWDVEFQVPREGGELITCQSVFFERELKLID